MTMSSPASHDPGSRPGEPGVMWSWHYSLHSTGRKFNQSSAGQENVTSDQAEARREIGLDFPSIIQTRVDMAGAGGVLDINKETSDQMNVTLYL